MARAKVLATRIRSWDLLNENLKPHLTEMPQVQPLQADLQKLLDDARALDGEQEDTRSRLRDLVRRRREVERQAEVVRRRVEAHLRGTYGYTNEQLIKFGIKPRPRIIRRKKSSKPPEESEAPPEQGLKKSPQSA